MSKLYSTKRFNGVLALGILIEYSSKVTSLQMVVGHIFGKSSFDYYIISQKLMSLSKKVLDLENKLRRHYTVEQYTNLLNAIV